ncbi:cellulose binding domain-containing protein [Kitasatospora nipponensis]|uniref:Cellulose binding domain-containing protein n=1 Tax=Kitasatospora nipponensis TaxID=258049 RepID=A0ABN1WJR4_9ACTN
MPPRRKVLTTAAVALGVMAMAVQQSGAASPAQARPLAPPALAAAAATSRAGAFADPATGSTALSDLGATGGWKVLTSATATQGGARISTPGFGTGGWLSVANDGGGAPGTEINALLQNGSCPNVFSSTNMKSCFGQLTKIGAETLAQFSAPWWYRTDFTAPPAGQNAKLVLNGVIGAADVWVNGTEVATAATVTGGYARTAFDVTKLLVAGTNSVAIEMHPNNPATMLTVDNVDWSQIPPDNNTGIQFPVQLQSGGPLVEGNAHVVQNTSADLSSSALTVKSEVTNTTTAAQSGTVSATVTPPGGGTPITVSQNVTVAAGATQTVTFTPAAYPALTLSRPQIWWPYQLGAQPLYALATSVAQGGTVLNSTSGTFGIRTVTSSLVGASSAVPDGVRAFRIDNVPLVIRGGGWDPDLFLRYDPADTARQIGLLKAMGVNTVRLEGHFMPADWYRQMDAAGLLVNAGYQCCDFWENTSYTAAQQANYQLTAQSVGETLRDHPSVFSFQWSDNEPTATQETLALNGFRAADLDVPFIASAEYKSSPQLGASGEKEGPYDWVPPSYWYDTAHSAGGDQTNAGGAWGFDSEQSAGNTVPTLDSINRFLSPAEQSTLWQTPGANQYHDNYEGTSHTGYHFGTNYNLDTAITNRYGAWSSLSQYVQEAQVQNYEDTRAQFEAYLAHSTNASAPSTGTVYWMLNKGWPTMLWSLYNNDGDQAGAYFGAQKANRPLHALYALDTGAVTLDNLGGTGQSGVSVEAKVYDTKGAVLDDRTSGSLTLAPQQVLTSVLKPALPAAAGTVYFVELLVRQNGAVVDRNVYWNSTTPDATNWSKTIGQPQATMTSYANLKALQSLPQATVSATAKTTDQAGPGGADKLVTVTVTNTSSTPTVGFFLRADLRRGTAAGAELAGDNELQSSIWNDNDVTLWPGESETLTASYRSADLQGATPVVSLSGWNAPKTDVPAGTGTGSSGDFSIGAAPAAGSVTAGASTTSTVSTAVTAGSAQPLTLTATGAPAGTTVTLTPATVTAGGSATATVATGATTAPGSYPITLTATGPNGSHSTGYTLTVTKGGTGGCTAAQLLADPGFENGANPAPWTQTSTLGQSPVNNDTADEPTHSGSWDAWLNGDGKADTDTLSQTVTIPSTCTTATLGYWLHVDSTEKTTGAAADTLKLQVLDTAGTVLATPAGYSNLDHTTGYTQHTADLSAYAGQTVTLRFTGTETDTAGGTTSFLLDDTALQTS